MVWNSLVIFYDSWEIPSQSHQKNVVLVKFNCLIKLATSLLAKKFNEHNEEKAAIGEQDELMGEGKPRMNEDDDILDEEEEEDEVYSSRIMSVKHGNWISGTI